VESKYSVKSRDSSLSRDRGNSYSRDFEQRETTVIVDSSKPRFFTVSSRTSSLDSEERRLCDKDVLVCGMFALLSVLELLQLLLLEELIRAVSRQNGGTFV
jgi:hypothetical protein